MREYRSSLSKRRRDAARLNELYRTDPEFRLAKINRERLRRGAPTLASIEEVPVTWSRRPRQA